MADTIAELKRLLKKAANAREAWVHAADCNEPAENSYWITARHELAHAAVEFLPSLLAEIERLRQSHHDIAIAAAARSVELEEERAVIAAIREKCASFESGAYQGNLAKSVRQLIDAAREEEADGR